MSSTPSVKNSARLENIPLAERDPAVMRLIESEDARQRGGLQLIASENIVSDAVREASGSVFTNKYAEGRPGKRYYSGCEQSDAVENLAIDRAKQLFGTDYHVNVQPHSGTQANLSVYLAALKPGNPILAMDLATGGHLSHGSPYNASGKLYAASFYGVSQDNERIDYDVVAKLAAEIKPTMIVSGASAYPRTIDFERFGAIAKSCGALLLADISHIAGLVAAGEHPSPFGHADYVTTTTHKTLRGPRGGLVFCREELQRKLDSAVFPGNQGGPLMQQIAAKAVAFGEALDPSFTTYQRAVRQNAQVLATVLTDRGYRMVSGGTDNHLLLVDLKGTMAGSEAEDALRAHSIFVNKNLVPFDTQPPSKTSGIRLGTPAMTSRGLGESEFAEVGELIADVLAGKTADADERVARLVAKTL